MKNPMIDKFGATAQRLARNPLGIIALFIVLVYGMAALVTASSYLGPEHRLILVIFLVAFPFFVLFVFYRLVTKYDVVKLYGPGDFQNPDKWLEALGRIKTESELKEKVEKSAKEALIFKSTIEDVIKPEATGSQLLSTQYWRRWNSDNMVGYKTILENITSKNVKDTPDKLIAAVEILNFLEEVAIAVTKGMLMKQQLRIYSTKIL